VTARAGAKAGHSDPVAVPLAKFKGIRLGLAATRLPLLENQEGLSM